jgi:hypothetical protein
MVKRWRGGRVSEWVRERVPENPLAGALRSGRYPKEAKKTTPNTLSSGRPNWPSQQNSRLVLFLFCC